MLPRQTLFGNPDRGGLKISYDGKQLGWLAPKDGVMNVYVAPISDITKAKAVTDEKNRPINAWHWTSDGKHVLYAIDKNGDENVHVFSVDVAKGETKDLTPFEKTQGRIQNISDKFPNTVLLAMNDRDPKYHDIYKVDLGTGKRDLVQKNESYAGFLTDDAFKVRFALKQRPDGGTDVMIAEGPAGKTTFKEWQTIPQEDSLTTDYFDFDKAGKTLYFRDSRGRDTGALFSLDTTKKDAKPVLLAEDAKSDCQGGLQSPVDGHMQAALFYYDRMSWKTLDKAIDADLEALKKVVDGELSVTGRSHDDKWWTVAYIVTDGPVRYYLYDRTKKEAKFLFTNRAALEDKTVASKLAKMKPVIIKSRDGKELVSYLTLPASVTSSSPAAPLPAVLLVHGGPWARDGYGFNAHHQWLASRGYAVLSVNFRGSTGFGKSFVNAGDKEWAGKMHDDLLDATSWLVTEKIADKSKIAIMGGSYGGYATLVGLTFTPDVFACGVDIVGPSNLNTLLSTIPPYWAPMVETFAKRVGDPRTEDGKKLLDDRSPLRKAGAITKPLLIGQGANDPRVKQAESDQIAAAMTQKMLPVSYVLFPDEGHGFQKPANRIAFNAVTEIFLAQYLGGVYQPIGDDFKGSSISLKGPTDIPTVAEALPKK